MKVTLIFSGLLHSRKTASASFRVQVTKLSVSGARRLANQSERSKVTLIFVSCVAFSPDDKCLVSVSKDMVIRVWDVGEREVPSPTSNVTFQDELTMVDGWILGENSELLFWVPPTHRTALWRQSNVCVIGKNSTKLDVSHFVHGLSWQCCRGASRCKN